MNSLTKPRVVLDTNVFISAIVWGGNPEKVLNLWLQDKISLFVSPETLLEILEVLAKFQIPAETINGLRELIESHAQKIIPVSNFKVCHHHKDNKFLNLALDCRANYLITGDKDLLTLGTFKQTKILKPKNFLLRF
jgi:putative PIN family toxin of toxin-antitoxin system